jgi:hypothetical protein
MDIRAILGRVSTLDDLSKNIVCAYGGKKLNPKTKTSSSNRVEIRHGIFLV